MVQCMESEMKIKESESPLLLCLDTWQPESISKKLDIWQSEKIMEYPQNTSFNSS